MSRLIFEPLEQRCLLSGTISGTVFNDLDRSGVRDPGEPGLAGWQVAAELAFEPTGFVHGFQIPESTGHDEFGWSVAALGNDVLVGAPHADGWRGAVYWFDGVTGQLQHVFRSPRHQENEAFGSAITANGSRVLIGARNTEIDNHESAGSAYLFDATTRELVRSIVAPDPAYRDRFGGSVAFVGDNYLIGSPGAAHYNLGAGEVHLFDGATGDWLHTFGSAEPDPQGNFGYAVTAVGNNILIGAVSESHSHQWAGTAYYFDGSTYELIRVLEDPYPSGGGSFGSSVAALGDDLVIGASGSDTESAGAVYLIDGATGNLIRRFRNPTPAPDEEFGYAVATRGDYLLVGAYRAHSTASSAGEAYLFRASTGELLRTFSNPDPGFADYMGNAVAFVGDQILLGAYRDSSFGEDQGAAFLYAGFTEPYVTMTGPNGDFLLGGVQPGTYTVRQTLQADYAHLPLGSRQRRRLRRNGGLRRTRRRSRHPPDFLSRSPQRPCDNGDSGPRH